MVIAISTGCDDAHASVNVEKYIENHPMIDEFKDQDKQFDKKIEEIKKGSITNINKEITVIENFVTEEENLNESQKQIIEEVTNNVHKLIEQNDYINQWINYNKIRVILDVKYLNFEDWVDHVYMKKDPYTEDFKMGDIYINANQAVEATNAAYINTRDHGSMADYSANDWQEMYWSMPADTFTLQGIDPFEIHHPYRHEWTISINPEKLQDYIGSLKRLDLSYTKVSLGEVYFDPTVKENFEVKENVNVGIDTTTKDINVAENSEFNYVTIDTACIENIECDVETSNINVDGFVSVEHGMKVEDEFITHELDIDGTIELPDAKNIFIAGIHLEDWLIKAVQAMKIKLCCPPPPPPSLKCCEDCDDCEGCVPCKGKKCCEECDNCEDCVTCCSSGKCDCSYQCYWDSYYVLDSKGEYVEQGIGNVRWLITGIPVYTVAMNTAECIAETDRKNAEAQSKLQYELLAAQNNAPEKFSRPFSLKHAVRREV